jgi:catechol 2,3-dioxygenase-like lactoylglutathione lyase family enzyme
MTLTHVSTIPVLRSFDETRAKEFFVGFLGFQIDFEHRFEPGLPLFMQVSRDGIVFYVSEHFGDGSPGVQVTVKVTGLKEFHAELLAKNYGNARPGLERTEWCSTEMTISDPAGNRINFVEDDPE